MIRSAHHLYSGVRYLPWCAGNFGVRDTSHNSHATQTSRNLNFSIPADWLLVDMSKEGTPGSPLTTMTEEAAHNHHVVAKCLDPEVSLFGTYIFVVGLEAYNKTSTSCNCIALRAFI